MQFVFPLVSQEYLAALSAAKYNAAKIDLLKAGVTLGPALTLADCVAQVADFTGYAQGVLPASNPVVYPDPIRGGVSYTLPTTPWTVGATPSVTNGIYGFYIQTAAGSDLLCVVLFTAPVAMDQAGDTINLETTINQFGDNAIKSTINGNPA